MTITAFKKKWDANLYDGKHSFVSRYGEDLIQLLDAGPGKLILDLGCGTGHLTARIASSGADVVGLDNSSDMIAKAIDDHPDIKFILGSASDFHFRTQFDVIFSNAVLHWVHEKEKAIECMFENLKPGGRLVIEMGGRGNIQSILNAIQAVFEKHGMPGKNGFPWYFPSLSEYAGLLESSGFRVVEAMHFDRPTALQDPENGIKDWLRMFGKSYFTHLDDKETDEILSEIQETLKATNFRDGKWFADYKRLRVIAIKEKSKVL